MADLKKIENKKVEVEQEVDEEEVVEKTIPYDRFKTIVSDNKALKSQLEELTKFKVAMEKKAKEEEEKRLTDAGEYQKLTEKLKLQEQAMKNKASDMFLTGLAGEMKLKKIEYIKLFEKRPEVTDNLEIKDAKSIKEDFLKWKKENPDLFLDEKETKKVVPKTDSQRAISSEKVIDGEGMSANEKIAVGLAEKLDRYNAQRASQ